MVTETRTIYYPYVRYEKRYRFSLFSFLHFLQPSFPEISFRSSAMREIPNGQRSKNNRGGDRVVGTCPHRGMVPNRISSGFCAWYERDNDAVSYRYTSLLTNITSILFRVYIYTMSASIIHCLSTLDCLFTIES